MKYGCQLYTLRDYTKTLDEFARTLDRVAEMGYDGVQLSAVGCMDGENGLSLPAAAKMVVDRGMEVGSTHRSWDSLRKRTDEEVAWHHEAGCKYVAIGMAPSGTHDAGIKGYQAWLDEAKPVVEKLAESGITFGYHMHAIEFERFAPENRRGADLILDESPWLAIELDTYWFQVAGVGLEAMIHRLKGRLPFVHLKDLGVFGWTQTFAPIGEGNIEWDRILPAFESSGTQWALVEQDTCARDPFDCLKSSIEFLRGRK